MKFTRQMICRAAFVLVLGLVSSLQATATGFVGGKPWQIGDIVICFGSGTCNVLRIVNGSPVLLDQFSDGPSGGDTRGVAINNTLHLLVTDSAASNSGSTSNVVEYTIASLNPLGLTAVPIPHASVTLNPFSDSGANAQAVVVNSAGQMFLGNAGNGSTLPSIAELDPNGSLTTPTSVPPLVLPSNPFTLPANCTDSSSPTLLSMDLSADGGSLYLTSNGGTIRRLPLSPASTGCTTFANFGQNVTLYGIKDIPGGALTNVSSCKGTVCPTDEAILVVAKGFTDPDAAETGDTTSDAVNICTNAVDQNPVSCALLLDTNPNPGLTSPLWQAGTQYFSLGAAILDPFLHQQTVFTAGTSGADEPAFSQSGEPVPVIDNAVIWTDKGQPAWVADTPYAHVAFPGTYIVDSNFNLQTVTTTGISGHTQPVWNASGTTTDGLVWKDQGAWQANHPFSLGLAVGDAAGHPHTVVTAGTSGSGALPAGGWNDSGGTNGGLTVPGITIDNAVIWTNQGPVVTYTPNYRFALNTLIVDVSGHAQQAIEPGRSGSSGLLAFSPITGGRTIDNAVTWTDQGQEFWHPNFAFGVGAVVVDPAGHVQVATTAGTSGPTQPPFTSNVPSAGQTTDGLQWTNQGAPVSWTPGGAPSLNAVILDSNLPQHVQQVVVAGTSGGSAPTFSATGGYTLDGTVLWLDRGVNSYQANHPYNVGDAFFDGTNIQQATSAGTSGISPPAFTNSAGAVTPDNAVVWTDQGVLTWQLDHNYTATTPTSTYIVDLANHVQKVTTPGTSGPSQPTFNDAGMTMDNTVVWQDQGQEFWRPSSAFGAGAVVVDPAGHVQLVSTAGTSGPTQPPFTSNIPSTGQTTDGLQWTDQSAPVVWGGTSLFSANQFILDNSSPTPHVQQVVVGGTSGGSMPTFSVTGGYTLDGAPGTAVVWLDRGVSTYQPNHPYNVGDAFFDSTDVQQATSAGTSGTSSPTFANIATTVTPDNAVVWTDEGALAWQAGSSYTATTPGTTYIVDPAGHVQKVTTAGISGGSIPSPFISGTVIDGLVWIDIGLTGPWTAGVPFSTGTLFVDPGIFLQKVTSAGNTGTPAQPSWNENPGGFTVDGLQWSDQGLSVWTANHQYFTLGTLISDAATHAQKVTEAGTSGATIPAFNDAGGMTIDNAVTWTESHPQWAASHGYVTGNPDTLILDDAHSHVQLVSTSGISGPTTPPFTSNHPVTGQTIDGLQWTNQAMPATSVVARYPVTGKITLQSLALDPLITDCRGSNCSTSLPTPKVSNFWLGDSGSALFYKLDFATGSPTALNGSPSCGSGCATFSSIQAIGIYGAEGSNQPDLTMLLADSLSSGNSYTASVKFPPAVSPFTSNDVNTWTVTAYNLGSNNSPIPVKLYGSLIDKASAPPSGNSSGATDPGAIGSNSGGTTPEGISPCAQTTTFSTKCIIWKADLQFASLSSSLAENITSTNSRGVDNGTDVFVDLHYDVTSVVGNVDPAGHSSGSVHSLHEVSTTFTSGGPNPSGCIYVSPSPNGACFKSNRGSLPFEFQCPGVPSGQFVNMQNKPGPPLLSIVQFGTPNLQGVKPAPQPIPLTTTNGKAPYRFNGSDYIFNWSPKGITGKFRGCTFDPTKTVQTFCVDFTMKTSCP